jgi:hypothetical protein
MGHITRRLHVPVRFVDGIWECAFGGALPVKNDAEAELLVSPTSISDKTFLEAMERKEAHKVLNEGTALYVCLTIKPDSPPAPTLEPFLEFENKISGGIDTTHLSRWNSGKLAFVEVTLGCPTTKQAEFFGTIEGGLWLMTRGVEAVGVRSTTVVLPEKISEEPIVSLNHAYTVLSEAFEDWRKSHTGNIYERVFYRERNDRWYALDTLRNRALHKQEQDIARELWEGLMARMTPRHGTKD